MPEQVVDWTVLPPLQILNVWLSQQPTSPGTLLQGSFARQALATRLQNWPVAHAPQDPPQPSSPQFLPVQLGWQGATHLLWSPPWE